ncbi:OmpA family protein [Mesorhizobium sp. KR9-304]|uniref:OmpA family protein n=1 Tax=Mesorhizobium sp. KR9-304 TaxID=3156614 RepID=UPI0032B4F232
MKRAMLAVHLLCMATLLPPSDAAAFDDQEINNIIRSLAPADSHVIAREAWRSETVNVQIDGRIIRVDTRYSADFEVYFPFDSAALTIRAQNQLEALGKALESRSLRPYTYLIIGHTDAKGAAGYNRELSLRRAQAVKSYLIQRFSIAPARLEVVGFGEDRPKAESEPFAAINRRVEVTMIVPPEYEKKPDLDNPSVTITIE